MDATIFEDLTKRGHTCQIEQQESVFGGAQLIQKIADGYVGGSDHRKEGLVSGF